VLLAETGVELDVLTEAIRRVANHRQTPIEPLSLALEGHADIAQPRWAAWRRKQQLTNTPERFADLLDAVIDFSEPLLQRPNQA